MKNYWKAFCISGMTMSFLAAGGFMLTAIAILNFNDYARTEDSLSNNSTLTAIAAGCIVSGIAGIICHRTWFSDHRTAILALVWFSSALLPLLFFLIPYDYDMLIMALIVVVVLTAWEAHKLGVSFILTIVGQIMLYFLTFLIIYELDYLYGAIKSVF